MLGMYKSVLTVGEKTPSSLFSSTVTEYSLLAFVLLTLKSAPLESAGKLTNVPLLCRTYSERYAEIEYLFPLANIQDWASLQIFWRPG